MDEKLADHGATREPAGHFPAVDGLRAVAVLGVIAFHLSETRVPGAFLAVDVFFVISGFVITTTLLREHASTGRLSLWQFYRRRWWRLAPAQVAVVILALPLVLVSGLQPVSTWLREAALGLTYTYNLGQAALQDPGSTMLNHLWSLSLEEQFYLFWPPLLAVLLTGTVGRSSGRRVVVWSTATLVVVFCAARAATASALGNLPAFFLPWSRFDEFLVGALVAFAVRTGVLRSALRPTLTGAAGAAFLLALVPATHIFASDWLYRGGFLAVALASGAVIGHVSTSGRSVLARALSWRPVVWLGQRSYGVYLYHLPVILTLYATASPRWVYGTVGPVVAVVLAAVSYRWLETPLRRRGTTRRRAHRANTPIGPATVRSDSGTGTDGGSR